MNKYITWTIRLVAAIIMLQTLYFKFSASPESVYIFSKIGMEPWGRIGIGILELVASILLLINTTYWIGAFLGMQLMSGAIFFHLTRLSISILGDNGYLFGLGVTTWLCCSILLWIKKEEILSISNQILSKFIPK